jgi:predicted dehydrogenase
VAATNPASAAWARERGGFLTATVDWRELVARDDVDVVDIASPNRVHAEQLLAAIQAGKHVYCDKPLTATFAEAERVEEALRGYRGIGQMTFHLRFNPAVLRAKQLIDEGFLGEPIGFRNSFLHSGSVDPERPMGWKQMASEGGGTLRDLGSHWIDLVDWLAGPLETVLAETRIL